MLDMLKFSRKPYKVGLVLSGGGARGFAHAGALLALEEVGIKPDIIAGVSAGSVVTAMYASGIVPEEIVTAFSNISFGNLAELGVPRDGFSQWTASRNFLRSKSNMNASRTSRFRHSSVRPTLTTTGRWHSRKGASWTAWLHRAAFRSCSSL